MTLLIAIWLGCLLSLGLETGLNPPQHSPVPQKWVIINLSHGYVAASNISSDYPFGRWFPDLFVDLCDIVDRWTYPAEWGCNSVWGKAETRKIQFYVCPGHAGFQHLKNICSGSQDAYCREWSCVSTGHISWRPPLTSDYITVHAYNCSDPGDARCGPNNQLCGACYSSHYYPWRKYATPRGTCNMLKITFTELGKKQDWTEGKNWGIRLYVAGTDPAATFMIKLLRVEPPSTPVGPNPVLPDQGKNVVWPPKLTQEPRPFTPRPIQTPCPTTHSPSLPVPKVSGPSPFKGMAIMSSYSVYTSAPLGCTSPPENSMTLSEVSGKGLCLGNIPITYQTLCHVIEKPSIRSYYLAAPPGAYWVCGTGLTPCVSSALLSSDYCVLIKM